MKMKGGIYHKTQIDLTYNSNHIEGSRLTHEQTRYIFETNTIGVTADTAVSVDDIVQTVNHFRCIDLVIDGTKILTPKRAQNILEQKDVDRLYELYVNYENVEDFSQVVTLDEIAEKGYDLSPNKYVKYHREAIKPYAEVLAAFKAAYEEVKLREAEFRKIINA